tara:strand:+ start:1437 stop:1583 length:147 start_codon:yes stop_codon:yes gene_type:complete
MQRSFIFSGIIAVILTFGLGACGKRGDPMRPSEIPEKTQQSQVNPDKY